MSINEIMESPTKARKKLGRHAQVVRYDDGSAGSFLNIMRIESTSVQTAVIEDLGNAMTAWTLNDYRAGRKVRCLRLKELLANALAWRNLTQAAAQPLASQ